MTTLTQGRLAPTRTILDRLADWQKAWRIARATRRAERQTLAELSALSDAELADIGITRSDIPSIARQAAAAATAEFSR